MNISHLGLKSSRPETLIVLGAGATRGASFVDEGNPTVLPPMNQDFFQRLSLMPLERANKEADELIHFTRNNFQNEVNLSMEEFLSEVEHTNRFHDEFNITGRRIQKHEKAINNFHKVLPEMLSLSTGECEYHEKLASKLLTDDVILSYNYDCVMDRALRDKANKKWDPARKSYGFRVSKGSNYWKSHGLGREAKNHIKLLKLHGSLNWEVEDNEVNLLETTDEQRDTKGDIIPPTWFKNVDAEPFASVWKEARKAVRSAKALIVIGYSVPDTDLFSRSLFKADTGLRKANDFEVIVLVNPDQNARLEFLNVVQEGIDPDNTKILQLETIEDLYNLIRVNE